MNTIKDMDKILLTVSIVLFVFGLFNIVTASSQVSVVRYNQSLYNYFYKQLLILCVGFVMTIVVLSFPTKSYYLFGKAGYFMIAALSILVTFKGENWSGNQNWITLPVIGAVQPSEFAKPFLIVYLSLLFEQFYRKLKNKKIKHYDLIGKILAIGIFFPIVIFTQKDYGTLLIITSIFIILFLASPILKIEKLKTMGLLFLLLVVGCLLLFLSPKKLFSSAQASRFEFFDPCSRYENGGYQVCNGFIAINSGGLLGVGIGNSRQKSYIPESHTDSVFAIIAEEYGFLFTSIIFFLYIVVLYRILKLATYVRSIRGKYMCFGIAIYIFLHIFINLGGLFGSLPLTGVPLPFLSYGGSFALALLLSLAIVQRIHVEYKNEKIKI